jgi:uncharacterized HAD superfamily protein
MGRRLRIGIDVDDVLVESLPGYLEAFGRRFHRQVRIEEAAWEIFPRFPDIPSGEMWEFYGELETTGFLDTRPIYPEAVRGVRALAGAGHRLLVVTGRLREQLGYTRRLLERAGILELFDALIHRNGESTARDYKPQVAREERLDLLIDDERHLAEAVAAVPVPVLLLDRPWNQGALSAGISRVTGWDQILSRVAELAGAS